MISDRQRNDQELHKTTQEMFKIEKVLKKKGTKSLVKWLG